MRSISSKSFRRLLGRRIRSLAADHTITNVVLGQQGNNRFQEVGFAHDDCSGRPVLACPFDCIQEFTVVAGQRVGGAAETTPSFARLGGLVLERARTNTVHLRAMCVGRTIVLCRLPYARQVTSIEPNY